jgi:transcriptional regulator with XRE-family HTH domain
VTRRETPIEWVRLLESKRLHSIRDLAAALDVSPQTATRLVHGEHSSRQTIEAAAELLGVTPERIRELRHEAALPPFRLPPEADQLSQRQRAAVVAVVRAMMEPAHAAAIGAPLPSLREVPTDTPGLRMVAAAYDMNPGIAARLEAIAHEVIANERERAQQAER